jgi:catechol 2,3-dioxygenase-like lactoylglutathione lyase family enzyme
MPNKASLAITVADLADSVDFYANRLGFELIGHVPDADVAHIVDSDGDLLLLVGPAAGDLTAYLDEQHRVLAPGDSIGFGGGDLAAQRTALAARGVGQIELKETRWGDRTLCVRDPDGYLLNFRSLAQRSPEEWLALYKQGMDELEAALEGLEDADLDLALAPGEWTIRQIVHHVADGDGLFLLGMKMALAEPDRTYVQNWPKDNQSYSANLKYAERDVAPSLALLRAIRLNIIQLIEHIPDAWQHSVRDEQGRPWTFERSMGIVTRHALEHAAEIREIRRVNGR